MPRLPIASHSAVPVTSESVMPTSAIASPISAPVSSSSTTGSSAFFVVWMKLHHDARPRSGIASRRAVRSESVSSTIATPSTPNAQIGSSRCSGWMSLSIPSTMANKEPSEKRTSATTNA